MERKSEFPFPQADDFDKIVSIVNLPDADKLSDRDYVSRALGEVTDRQVQYYISACQYLGLVTDKKVFSDLGDYVRSLDETKQLVELARLIVSHDIFGTTYFSEKVIGCKYSRDDVIEIMHDHDVGFESDEMYKRRAQTVVKWVQWINDRFDKAE